MASWAEKNDTSHPDLERAPDGTPLYVHLPFCASKCHYCDFFSLPDVGQDIDGTLDTILREAERRAPWHPRTVFFGGGTPSLLSVEQWARFAESLQQITGFRDSAHEITAECNPESLDHDKARCLLDLGIRRLSIGFQSLSDARLEQFGRVHTTRASFEAFEAARGAGVEELNIDMIFAAPDQTATEWAGELEQVLALRPTSFSAYNLTFEEGTTFHRWRAQGRLADSPEETELEMFHKARSTAACHGFEPYEISNYSLPGGQCDHNINYWENGPYLGIGPSAVSKVGQTRIGNTRTLGAYRKQVAESGAAIDWCETLEPDHRLGETWWLGLRMTRGLSPARAAETAACTDPEAQSRALSIAERLVGQGLLQPVEDRFVLTAKGIPLADAIATEFLLHVPAEAGRSSAAS